MGSHQHPRGTSKNSELYGTRCKALKACLEYLREGDTLAVTKLDRLARSTSDLYRIVSELMQRGVEFKVLDDPSIDTSSRTGKLVMGILALIAEFENDIRRERQQDGINKAKAAGIRFGPKPILTLPVIEKIKALRADGATVPEIMRRTKPVSLNPEPWSRLATPDCSHVSGKWVPCESRRGS
jgi:DNA invertase Pin-like site-specific DNA recombinase